jgi:hypothetical protein
MPISYRIDTERHLIHIRAWANVTRFELNAHHEKLSSDPEFKIEYDQLWDASDLQIADLSMRDIRQVAFFPWSSRVPCIAIVVSSSYVFEIAREFSTFAELTSRSIRIFRDLQDAQDWLESVRTSPRSE